MYNTVTLTQTLKPNDIANLTSELYKSALGRHCHAAGELQQQLLNSSVCMSVCLYVCMSVYFCLSLCLCLSFQMERRDFHRTDFREISHMRLLLRTACTVSSPIKSHKNDRHFVRTSAYSNVSSLITESVLCEVRAEAEKSLCDLNLTICCW
jgi:hypothetical protein